MDFSLGIVKDLPIVSFVFQIPKHIYVNVHVLVSTLSMNESLPQEERDSTHQCKLDECVVILGPMIGVLMSHVDLRNCNVACLCHLKSPLSPVEFKKWPNVGVTNVHVALSNLRKSYGALSVLGVKCHHIGNINTVRDLGENRPTKGRWRPVSADTESLIS